MHCAVYSRFIVCWVFANDSVLVSRNGKVLSNAQLRCVLDRVLRKANIDKPFTLHQLRHTFATRTLKAGVPISVVSKVAWPCEYFDNIQHLHSRSLF